MKIFRWALVLVCAGWIQQAIAGGNDLALLPAHGIYGLPTKAGGTVSTPLPPYISADFLAAIGYDQGAALDAIDWFQKETQRLFPASVTDTVTPRNKFRTYAVSMQVTRADQYSVTEPDGNVEVFLPVAVNVYFTNILTGEVLYSISRTGYYNLTETQDNYTSGKSADRIRQAYRDNLKALTTAILTQASTEFRPLQITATVMQEWKGYFIVDKGMDAGIAAGNELLAVDGSGLKIIQAGKTYAVGVPTLGEVHKGDALSFYSTSAAADVKKPKVLILDAGAPDDFPGAYASTQFAENLGGKASFTILPVNPDFQAVLNDVAANQGLKQEEVTQNRVLPGYFIRLKVLPPVMYELSSNHEYGKERVFEGAAFAELIDASGRVVYATDAQERIEDPVVNGGMAFDIKDRNKVLYANLLKTLSQRFIKEVQFSQAALAIDSVTADKALVKDHSGLLPTGADVQIFHSLDHVDGVSEPVLIPTWEAQVVDRQGDNVTLSMVLPTIGGGASPISLGTQTDQVRIEGSGSGLSSRLAFSLCDKSMDIGSIHLDALNDLTYFSLGESLKQPFFSGDYVVGSDNRTLDATVAGYAHAGFSKPLSVMVQSTPYCLQPLLKITETSRQCSADGVCDVALHVLGGVQVLQGDKKGPKKALGVDIKISNAPEKDIDVFESHKALLKTMELMPQIIGQLDISQL